MSVYCDLSLKDNIMEAMLSKIRAERFIARIFNSHLIKTGLEIISDDSEMENFYKIFLEHENLTEKFPVIPDYFQFCVKLDENGNVEVIFKFVYKFSSY